MAVTSSGAGEGLACTSLFTYDVYCRYIKPKVASSSSFSAAAASPSNLLSSASSSPSSPSCSPLKLVVFSLRTEAPVDAAWKLLRILPCLFCCCCCTLCCCCFIDNPVLGMGVHLPLLFFSCLCCMQQYCEQLLKLLLWQQHVVLLQSARTPLQNCNVVSLSSQGVSRNMMSLQQAHTQLAQMWCCFSELTSISLKCSVASVRLQAELRKRENYNELRLSVSCRHQARSCFWFPALES